MEKPKVKRVEPVTIEGYNEISGVLYGGENRTYQMMDNLTRAMTLPALSEYSQGEKELGNPYVPNAEELFSIFTAIANSEDESLIKNVRQKLRSKWIKTLTAIDWDSSGDAEVIHNVGASDSYSKQGKNLIGPDGYISETNPKKFLECVIGTGDIEYINQVSQKITNNPMYLWGVNSKPSKEIRKCVVFNPYFGGLGLDYDWGPLISNPAFRVLRVD